MAKPLKAEGRFKARIVNHAVGKTREKGLPQWVARFAAFEEEGFLYDQAGNQIKDEGGRPKIGWNPLDDEYEITSFITLGYLNKESGAQEFTYAVDNLIESLGWQPNPSDPFGSLDAMDLSGVTVQIVVQQREYQGNVTYEVAFVNPVDFEGGSVRKLDQAELTTLSATWAAAFAAKFGGGGRSGGKTTPAPRPAAPGAARPAAPAQTAAPAPRTAPAQAPAARPAPAAAPAPVAGNVPATAPVTPPAPVAPQSAPAPTQTAAPSPAAQAAPATPAPRAPQGAPSPAARGQEKPPVPLGNQAYAGGDATMEDAWAAFNEQAGHLNPPMTEERLGEEWFRNITEAFGEGAIDADGAAVLTPAQWGWARDHFDIIPF